MASILCLSDAATLALHAAVLLAESPRRNLTVGEMAGFLNASEAHLAKVMQRLSRAGLVQATRGPRGGFVLSRAPEDTTLLEVYEAIEGQLVATNCLLGKPVCSGQRCLLGGLLQSLNLQVRDYLSTTTLAQMAAEGAGAKPAAQPA